MLRIWGRDNSVNVQKATWLCEEIGLAYERRDAGLAYGVVNTPEYRRLNPNGLVPTMEENGFVLWESNSIVRYLSAKYSAGVLWPESLRTRAQADRWMDWMATTFWPAFRALFWNLVRTPLAQRDAAAMDASRRQTAEVLAYLEQHLAQHRYIAGEDFTMGDIPMGCAIWRWMELPIERPHYSHLTRWYTTLTQRAAYQKIVMQPIT